ncbi:hypothetical protein J19TS2_26260 [Cohnella xylanilytica]|uniref:hypothetical protein n=1 Tax=Cohnella xylanilytica TaxID=557555 RepID=UPI001B0564AD|nr:hypothetical protein [Cohnella xylanilytica]GIO13071.1 hypothetical protein J19TS2_26260 [Cohnella xylanilytica]
MAARRHSPLGHRILAVACGLALVGSLAACNYTSYYQKSAHDYSSRAKNDPKMTRVRSYGASTGDPKQHENRYFEYSSKLSYDVKALPGVNSAIVMLTDKNAYVAILTDWTATGTKSHGGAATREQDNTGTTEGVYNVDTGGTTNVGPRLATPYNSYFTHKDVSDLSSELKQVIGDTVRRGHPRVQEVHISANREFVNQMLEFAKLSWGNKPLAPHTQSFNRLVQYTFANGRDIPLPLYEHPPATR